MSTTPPSYGNGGDQTPPEQPPQPPQGGEPQYGPPPTSDPASTISLNYWLSVFFTWIPALIFYVIEKDKGDAQSFAFHRENLNFSLTRTLAGIAVGLFAWIFVLIPYIGWFISLILWLGLLVLFIFHIVAAARAANDYRSGSTPQFIWTIRFLK